MIKNTASAPLPSPLPESGLGDRLHHLMCLLGQLSAGDSLEIMAESDLTMPQIVTLHDLRTFGSRSVSTIASRLKLSKAATSHLVDQLVKRGFVSRCEDKEDRRKKVVSISKRGAALLDRLERSRKVSFNHVIEFISPELQKNLDSVLVSVLSQLKKQADKKGTDKE